MHEFVCQTTNCDSIHSQTDWAAFCITVISVPNVNAQVRLMNHLSATLVQSFVLYGAQRSSVVHEVGLYLVVVHNVVPTNPGRPTGE